MYDRERERERERDKTETETETDRQTDKTDRRIAPTDGNTALTHSASPAKSDSQYTLWSIKKTCHYTFNPHDVVSAVYATGTWLAGWVAGWMSHDGIVSKRLNLS